MCILNKNILPNTYILYVTNSIYIVNNINIDDILVYNIHII